METYLRCAGDTSGQFSVWQDGVQIYDFPNVQTRYGDGEWSVNNYSDGISPSPVITYMDDAVISTARARTGFGTPPSSVCAWRTIWGMCQRPPATGACCHVLIGLYVGVPTSDSGKELVKDASSLVGHTIRY